jgi:RNA polymerase sigma-70 factor (ECF subfamily)
MRFDPEFLVTDIASHRQHLYRFALKELRDPVAADDAVQDTLAAALASPGRFEGRSGMRTWLTGILKHKVMDEYRRRAREPRAAAGVDEDGAPAAFDLDELPAGAGSGAPCVGCDPEYALARKRFWDAFSAHLGGMPAQMARAFAMHAIDGRDTDEVCAALGITPGNLWVLLHRARGKLRDAVDGDSRQYFLGLR